jgi:hypothetical protein
MKWVPAEPKEVIRPSEEYEGIRYPIESSRHGPAVGVQELRDPFVMIEQGMVVMFYTGAGEAAICGSKVTLCLTV